MNKEVLKRFLSNQCSYKESELLARFFEENEHELDDIEIFENLRQEELVHFSDYEKERILRSILPQERRVLSLKKLLIASTVLFFCIFSFYKTGFESNTINSEPWVYIINTELKSKWFLLPDSSRVKLEPEAHLAYRANFTKNRELIQKRGEVTYFVYPDAKNPFRVINQGIQTKAIGTIFSIGQHNKASLIIKLVEGKIVLEDYNKDHLEQVFLTDQATVIINTDDFTYQRTEESKVNYKIAWDKEHKNIRTNYPLSSIVWSNQVVAFNGVSNADLFNIMERLFAVTIDVSNPEIVNGNFTGQLYHDDNIEDLLKNFCQINGCVFTVEDNVIRIK